jgi:hypothetical protein
MALGRWTLHLAMGLSLCALSGCATLPEPSGGDQNLPDANAGPFRALVAAEIGNDRSAPNGLDDFRDYGRDIAVLDADGDPSTLAVIGYVAAAVQQGSDAPEPTDPTRSIARYDAADGRSFDLASEVVLTPDAPWEGGVLASPAAVRMGGEIWLYYAAQGGIGLAKSADGHAFTKVPGPVLGPSPGGWERGGVPAAPGVVQLPDGSLRMFYEVAVADGGSAPKPPESVTVIGEAESADGLTWTRLGSAPALAHSSGGDAGATPWDSASVGSPYPQLATSAVGRPILRVFYGARDVGGVRTVALAARYGTDGPLQRSESPVFGTSGSLGPREPCVVTFAAFTLLYATEASSSSDTHPAVAVGVAPATAVLPAPTMATTP